MLIIRREQLDVLEQDSAKIFPDSVEDILKRDFPTYIADLQANVLKDKVRQGIARARAWDLERREDIIEFVCLLFVINWELDEHEPFRSILEDTPPCIIMDMLFDKPTKEDWRRVTNKQEPENSSFNRKFFT